MLNNWDGLVRNMRDCHFLLLAMLIVFVLVMVFSMAIIGAPFWPSVGVSIVMSAVMAIYGYVSHRIMCPNKSFWKD